MIERNFYFALRVPQHVLLGAGMSQEIECITATSCCRKKKRYQFAKNDCVISILGRV